MINIACDICLRKLPTGDARLSNHFCERCQPFAEEYIAETRKLFTEGLSMINRSIEKYRTTFLQQKVVPSTRLKAV